MFAILNAVSGIMGNYHADTREKCNPVAAYDFIIEPPPQSESTVAANLLIF